MNPQVTRVVIDTNILLHFSRPDQAAWNAFLAPPLEFLIPVQVIRELDRHKYSSRARLQKRARSVLPWLEKADGKAIREDVRLTVLTFEPVKGLAEHPMLDPHDPDDRIIAQALELQNSGIAPVVLVANDTTPRMKAKAHGLEALVPPDSLRLAEDPTHEQQEIERLRSRTRELENRAPRFEVFLPEDSSCAPVGPIIEDLLRERHSDELAIWSGHRKLRGGLDEHERRARFMRDGEELILETEAYLRWRSRLASINLAVKNLGSALATKIHINLEWEQSPTFIKDRRSIPGLNHGYTVYGISPQPEIDISRVVRAASPPQPTSPLGPIGDQGGQSCSFRVGELLHRRDVHLQPVDLLLLEPGTPPSVALLWEVHCAELVAPMTGTLTVPLPPRKSLAELVAAINNGE